MAAVNTLLNIALNWKKNVATTNGCESFHNYFGDLFEKRKKNSSIKTFLIHLECQTAMGEIEVRDSEPKQKPVYIHYWQAVISRVID